MRRREGGGAKLRKLMPRWIKHEPKKGRLQISWKPLKTEKKMRNINTTWKFSANWKSRKWKMHFQFHLVLLSLFLLIRNSSSFYLFVFNSQIYFPDEFRISQFMCWMKSLRWVRCLWWDFRWRLNCESHSGLDLFSFFAIVSKQKKMVRSSTQAFPTW